MKNSNVQSGSIVARPVVAQQCFRAHWPLGMCLKIGERRPWLPAASVGRFRRAESPGLVGKGARHDVGAEGIKLEELGRSGAHR
jgi:hypothetical protein